MYNIFNVLVDKISLIKKGKRPAVPKAEIKYAIFKNEHKKLDVENLIKLEKVKLRLQKDIEKIQNNIKKE